MLKPTRAHVWRAGALVVAVAALALLWAAFAPIRGSVSADPPLPEAYPTSNRDALRPMGDRLDVAGDTVLVWMAGAGERSLFGVDCTTRWLATAKSGLPTRYAPPPPGSIAERMVADVCRAAPLTVRQRLSLRLGWVIPQLGPSEQEKRMARLRAELRRVRARQADSAARQPAMMDSLMVDSAMARDTKRPGATSGPN